MDYQEEDQEEEEELQDNFQVIPRLEWLTKLISFQADFIHNFIATLFSPFTALYSIASESYRRAEEFTVPLELALLNFPSILTHGIIKLVKKLVMGILGAVHMCMVLVTVMVLAVILGVGLVQLYAEEPVILKERLFFDYAQVNPSAVFSFGGGFDGWFKKRRVEGIPVGHTFQVSLVLLMPDSDYNRDIGVFQLTAEVLSANGNVIARSSQPCMLRFRSLPIRLLRTFLMGIPLVLGIFEETQNLYVQMLKHREGYPRTKAVRIALIPRAGTSFVPQLYEAEMLIMSQLPWRKELVRNWKWTFYVWSSLYTYILLLVVLLCFCRSLVFPMGAPGDGYPYLGERDSTPEEEPKEPKPESREGRDVSDVVRRWKERIRKRKAASRSAEVSETIADPSATSMVVTKDDASRSGVFDDNGDIESVCSGGL